MDEEVKMDEEPKNAYRYGPTRGELKFWLAVSVGCLGLVGFALAYRGLPQGPAMVEVIGLPLVAFSYLGGRSIKRLVRREHP